MVMTDTPSSHAWKINFERGNTNCVRSPETNISAGNLRCNCSSARPERSDAAQRNGSDSSGIILRRGVASIYISPPRNWLPQNYDLPQRKNPRGLLCRKVAVIHAWMGTGSRQHSRGPARPLLHSQCLHRLYRCGPPRWKKRCNQTNHNQPQRNRQIRPDIHRLHSIEKTFDQAR